MTEVRDRSWGAVVVDEAGRYLLVRHANGGHWDHPKGHPESGETPEETALREIREEGGIAAELIQGFAEEARWTLPDGRGKTVVYFLARKTAESTPTGPEGEILETAWLSYIAARRRITYETGKNVLDRAEAFLRR